MNCRHCGNTLTNTFVDLGFAPPSNAYLTQKGLTQPEVYLPLKVMVCELCWLVQTEDYATRDLLFTPDYAYFSSTSKSWLLHAKDYVDRISAELCLNGSSNVIEVASNDGYLLKNFVTAGIPCTGIEPASAAADEAESLGIPVIREFFGESLGNKLARAGQQADLIVGNNVYAHVPDINDFTKGLKAALKPGGTITLEFPHLMQLLRHAQFDTIYHEHFSYLSLTTVSRIFEIAGLRVWNVEVLPTHGGSLRVFGCHSEDDREVLSAVREMKKEEISNGLQDLQTYATFQNRAGIIKDDLVRFLIDKKRNGEIVVGYGAAAKGNTLLNFAGVKPDLLPFVCDAAKIKQGKFLPGSHIPILAPETLSDIDADFLLIFPWNIFEEVKDELASLLPPDTKLVTAIPSLQIR